MNRFLSRVLLVLYSCIIVWDEKTPNTDATGWCTDRKRYICIYRNISPQSAASHILPDKNVGNVRWDAALLLRCL